jgi:uncharacterized lipoprotein YddW (UPF0748 family)
MTRWVLFLIVGCDVALSTTETSDGSSDPTPASTTEEPTEAPDLVSVSHPRELRGIWLTTAWNIDFPKNSGSGPAAHQQELADALDIIADSGFNTVFFQVRSAGDAMYASAYEPWSRSLTGTEGQTPGWDPLATLIELAHARQLLVHAWLNPYRAGLSTSHTHAPTHISQTHPDLVVTYGTQRWMDPGRPLVRARLLDVIDDLLDRYDLDGIHFDDYFYPYPITGTPFPDSNTYADYQATGGLLSLADWRRQNVNDMVRDVHELVQNKHPTALFGISPFGIYRPDHPPGITGLDAYASLYADSVAWSDAGLVDYLAPQLYWPSTQDNQAFGPLVDWWSALGAGRHATFAGLAISRLGNSEAWTLDEFATQVAMSRDHRGKGSLGNIWYSYAPIRDDRGGVRAFLRDEIYPTPAWPPVLRSGTGPTDPPVVTVNGRQISVQAPIHARSVALYRYDGDRFVLDDLTAPAGQPMILPTGTWAFSALYPDGRESLGVRVKLEE